MDEKYELVRRIMVATNKIDGIYYMFAKSHNQNLNTLAFIYAISDGKPHSQKSICDEWLIPKTTINSIVKSMLKNGYIEFCPEHHGKEKNIILTKSGISFANELLSDIYDAEQEAISSTLCSYPPEFVDAMEDFVTNLINEFHRVTLKSK